MRKVSDIFSQLFYFTPNMYVKMWNILSSSCIYTKTNTCISHVTQSFFSFLSICKYLSETFLSKLIKISDVILWNNQCVTF